MQIHIKVIIRAVAIVFLLQACAHGPYKGRVVDERTGEPVAGAVAIGYWTYMVPTAGGGATECLDARETVSDDKGEFTIPTSAYGELFGEMSMAVYKVGYRRVECLWESLKIWGGCMTEPAEWDGDRAIILLEAVAKGRLKYEGRPPSVGCGRKDGKPLTEYIKAHDDYRYARGIKP